MVLDDLELDHVNLRAKERRPAFPSVVRSSRQGVKDFDREVPLPVAVERSQSTRVVEYSPNAGEHQRPEVDHRLRRVLTEITDWYATVLRGRGSVEGQWGSPLRPFVGFGIGLSEAAERAIEEHDEDDWWRVRADYDGALLVYSPEKLDPAKARDLLLERINPTSLGDPGVDIRTVQVGNSGPARWSGRFRRPCAGCSIFHHVPNKSATFGGLAVGRSGRRAKQLLLLSNSHVLAPHPARIGDSVVHPGPGDGGVEPDDRLGRLERRVRLHLDRPNYVDAATARVNPDHVTRGVLWHRTDGTLTRRRFPVKLYQPAYGMPVAKSGRTTGVTRGYIRDANALVELPYPNGLIGFAHQIQVVARPGQPRIAHRGDSGSIVFATKRGKPVGVVGLLFAADYDFDLDRPVAYANPIDRVVEALDIDLYT